MLIVMLTIGYCFKLGGISALSYDASYHLPLTNTYTLLLIYSDRRVSEIYPDQVLIQENFPSSSCKFLPGSREMSTRHSYFSHFHINSKIVDPVLCRPAF